MRWGLAGIGVLAIAAAAAAEDERFKPYIMAGVDAGTVEEVKGRAEAALAGKGFEVVGAYAPMEDPALAVICVTHPLLKDVAAKAGGLLGFSAVLRVGLHGREGQVEVAYTDPLYWGRAYFRKEYEGVEETYNQLAKLFRAAFEGLSETRFASFGSERGLTAKQLRGYHYMVAMPYFDDVGVLAKKTPYEESVRRIDERLAAADAKARPVYAVKFPEQKMALYGLALRGDDGEKKFLPKIDLGTPRHTPFLPYEMLVLEDRVVMLHGKYRIALSFPDLGMGTFMKIVSTPGDIEDALRAIARP